MPDEEPTTSQESVEIQEPMQAPDQEQDHSPEPDSQNPFWGDVEKQVGPQLFKQIKPHLDRADAEARSRVSKVNEAYAPFKAFAEQGITPEQLNQAIAVTRQLNEQPEVVYEAIGSFLEREGRMPSKQELVEEVQNDDPEGASEEEDPRDVELRQLRETVERLNGHWEQQEQLAAEQQANEEAEQWLSSEVSRIKQAHPDLDDAAMKDIIQRMTVQVSQGQEPNIEVAAAQFIALRDRILTTPRPTATAPRVPSGSGGSPAASSQPSGPMSKAERQARVAAYLQQQH